MSTARSGMSNGVRHALGAAVGLAAAPLILALLAFGIERQSRVHRLLLEGESPESWGGVGYLLLAALVLGLLLGSRVSPLASLLCGLILCAVNLPWLVMSRTLIQQVWDLLPREYQGSFNGLGGLGIPALLGGVLIVGSLPPSRWRSTASPRPAAPPQPPAWTPPGAPVGPGAAPAASPPGPGAPATPPGPGAPAAPAAGPGGAPAGQPPVGVPVGPGAPFPYEPGPPYIPPQPTGDAPPPKQYGPPPAQPRQDAEEGEQPGEWTRIYGGESPGGEGSGKGGDPQS